MQKLITADQFPIALVEIKPSKVIVGEIGVFAVRDLEVGTGVGKAEFLDESFFCTWDEYEKLDKETKRVVNAYCIGNSEGFDAPMDINYISIPWNYNHSCDPNVGFDDKGNFVVIKLICKGEEMFYDYGMCETNQNFRMDCKCGSAQCRKVITGNDWKNKEFREKNVQYFMPELREIVMKN
jgi:hypothetical protein